VFGYGVAYTMCHVLSACGNDLSRENIMKQALNLNQLRVPGTLPHTRLNTSSTDYVPMKQLQLQRWNGKTWERFGDLIEGSNLT
jgi:branched-chain amino acid transport system substrate-binding protein